MRSNLLIELTKHSIFLSVNGYVLKFEDALDGLLVIKDDISV